MLVALIASIFGLVLAYYLHRFFFVLNFMSPIIFFIGLVKWRKPTLTVWLTWISGFGIWVSTAAMVIVLSAFNGFEGVVEGIYTSFDADLKVEIKEGKSFDSQKIPYKAIEEIEGISHVSYVIEEITLVKHEDRWITCTMKGIEHGFLLGSRLDTMIIEGFLDLGENGAPMAIMGYGIKNRLGVTADPRFADFVSVHGLVRSKKLRKNTQPFNKKTIPVGGVFSINPEYDETYIMVPLSFASDLLEYGADITGVEINCADGTDLQKIKEKVLEVIGPQFKVRTYFEQNELMYQVHQSEKGMTFIILSFILVLSSFTLIASLTMLIIDKKNDIMILASMGASVQQIRRIFYLQGLMINFAGALLGIATGYFICWIQIKFHIIKLGGAIVPYYPVETEWADFLLIMLTVACVGLIATYFPTKYLVKRHFDQAN